MAIINISVRSTEAKLHSGASSGQGTVDLSGQVTINLDTILNDSLELNGTVTNSARKGGETTHMTLSSRLLATKSFVRGSSFP